MTDMSTGLGGTVSCPSCGNQVELPPRGAGQVACPKCGSPVEAGEPDYVGSDVTADEVLRSYGANGYDVDFLLVPEGVACPSCEAVSAPDQVRADDLRPAMDELQGGSDVLIAALVCPSCGAAGRLMLDAGVDEQRAVADAFQR